jgi:hypothetical protein
MDNYDSRGDLPIPCDSPRWCVCLMRGQNQGERNRDKHDPSMYSCGRTPVFLLSVVTALGHSLDVTSALSRRHHILIGS